jgi:hypothetical protein
MLSARHSKISPIFAARSALGNSLSNSGIGSRSMLKRNLSSSPILITRSCQPSAHMTAWRIGNASKNSLASTISGPSGTCSIDRCHDTGTSAPLRPRRCRRSSAGLISIK